MGTCSSEWKERLSAYFDGESGSEEAALLTRHVEQCPGCSNDLADFSSLRKALRGASVELPPEPAALREQLVAKARARPERRRTRPLWRSLAAGFAAALILWTAWPAGLNDALAMDVERHHLKSFSRTSPCEFESSDPAAVRAWIERELGYSVRVPEIPGAILLGARRCRLRGELSASLQYRWGDRAMTLFLPPPGSAAAKDALRFTGAEPRCTAGPVGERICVAPAQGGAGAALAVSEVEPSVLVGALTALSP